MCPDGRRDSGLVARGQWCGGEAGGEPREMFQLHEQAQVDWEGWKRQKGEGGNVSFRNVERNSSHHGVPQ